MRTFVASLVIVCLAVVAGAAQLLEPGTQFPEWSMTDNAGNTLSSTALAGTTYLLWFYPRARTPGCTTEGLGFQHYAAEFKAAGVELIGVSYDDPKKNARFADENGFEFLLLTDANGTLARKVGAGSADSPVASRVSYLIGPDGTVIKAYPNVDPASHAKQVLDDIKMLPKQE